MNNSMGPLADYGITRTRGFVPAIDPLRKLPPAFACIERVSRELPVHLKQGSLSDAINSMGSPDLDLLNGTAEQERLFLALGIFANAWVWGQREPDFRIPETIAVPLTKLASALQRKAVLTYASMTFFNWEKIDPAGEVCAENTRLLCGFLGTRDETWFVTSALHLEVACAPLLATLYDAVAASSCADIDELEVQLSSLASQMHVMTDAVLKVREQCDPATFYNDIRPLFSGWPCPGAVYESISQTPRVLAGASAAQSPLIQSFDAALGIRHSDKTAAFLDTMTSYMMTPHRRFILDIRQASRIRTMVMRNGSASLKSAYNSIAKALTEFRRRHFQLVNDYVTKPSRQTVNTGTGGSSFSEFLRDAGAATRNASLPADD